MGDSATTPKVLSTAVEIRCPPEYTVLSLIRLFISDVARHMGFEEDSVSEIELCVDEACANVIDHAYGGEEGAQRAEQEVELKVGIGADRLTVVVMDHGVGSEGGFETGTTDLGEYQTRGEKPRGLGLYIINKLMDSVNMEFPGNGTRLTMTKIIPGSTPPEPEPEPAAAAAAEETPIAKPDEAAS